MSTIIFNLALLAIIIFAIVFGDCIFTLAMYILYRYDGGRKSLKWYNEFMKDAIIEW